jgi:hypothetical protein
LSEEKSAMSGADVEDDWTAAALAGAAISIAEDAPRLPLRGAGDAARLPAPCDDGGRRSAEATTDEVRAAFATSLAVAMALNIADDGAHRATSMVVAARKVVETAVAPVVAAARDGEERLAAEFGRDPVIALGPRSLSRSRCRR